MLSITLNACIIHPSIIYDLYAPHAPKTNAPLPQLFRNTRIATFQYKIDKSHHNISFSFLFCSAVKVVGNLTLYFTMKFPLCPGFFVGMPRSG